MKLSWPSDARNLAFHQARHGHTCRGFCIAITSLLLYLCAASAQNPTGSVSGVITDTGRARISGAAVVIEAPDSKQSRHLVSDARGEFRAGQMEAGRWQIAVQATGFQSATASVVVRLGATEDVAITLVPGGVPRDGWRYQ